MIHRLNYAVCHDPYRLLGEAEMGKGGRLHRWLMGKGGMGRGGLEEGGMEMGVALVTIGSGEG